MELIDYTNRWLAAEILEGKWIFAFGVFTAIVGFLLWRYGGSDNARALIIPTFVVAALLLVTGYGMWIGNQPRFAEYAAAYDASPRMFFESETARVAGFMKMYPWSPIICCGLFVVGTLLLIFVSKAWVKASAIALMYVALSLTVIDFFSQKNGERYQNNLRQYAQTESIEKG